MKNEDFIKNSLIPSQTKLLKKILANAYSNESDKKATHLILKNEILSLGIYQAILNESVEEIKSYLSYSAMLNQYFIDKYSDNWLPLPTLMKLSLCDNNSVLQNLASKRKIEYYLDQNGELGYLNCFYNIIEGDWEGLKENIVYLKSRKGEYPGIFFPDIHFKLLESFASQDPDGIEVMLGELEKDEYRKIRIKYFDEERYISFATLAYVKQARKHGFKVFMDKEFLPKYLPAEWLDYKPLVEYTIPFKFLRDYYREQGIDWRYDPIYPELQDWENDLENPDRKKGGFFKKLLKR